MILTDTFFLDTNVLLDYLERRNREVFDVVSELLQLNKKGKIVLATSIINLAELLEIELDIAFYGKCMKKRMSYDEIMRHLRTRDRVFEMALDDCKIKLESKVKKLFDGNSILLLSLPDDSEPFEQICDLGLNQCLSSQDLVMITTALAYSMTYFLSNDEDLVKKISQQGWFYAVDLKKDNQRETFRNTVLKVIQS
jgi:predicted nucleic acid-binding protein